MRSMLALVSMSFLCLVAAGCQDGTRSNTRLSLATVCAVEVATDTPASAKVGAVEVIAIDAIAIDPGPIDPPPPEEETVPVACCLLSDGTPAPAGTCDPMDYPPETCDVLPDADDATIITQYTEEDYEGEAIPTAIFGCQPEECEEGDEDCEEEEECEEDTYSLNVNGAVAAVAFDSPTRIRVYSLGSASQVRTETADALHAVVPMGHTFFDPNHLVYQNGVLIGSINAQTDCFPTRCGFTCSIC